MNLRVWDMCREYVAATGESQTDSQASSWKPDESSAVHFRGAHSVSSIADHPRFVDMHPLTSITPSREYDQTL